MPNALSVSFADVTAAAARVRPYVHRTPVMTSRSLDARVGAELFFKCENLQRVGAFKYRGACNAVFALSDDQARGGVATHSSGNFAQALALAARTRRIDATVVMPRTAPRPKVEAVRGYGAEIRFCEPTLAAREAALDDVVRATGATFLHPYDDPRVIAGQGTATLELLEQAPTLDVVIAPVGGGGLLSGTAIAAHGAHPDLRVIGAEPSGADDAWRSLREGRIVPSVDPDTVADGLLTSLGRYTFPILRAHVAEIVRVEDERTVEAMRLVMERMKLVVEPSAAVPLGALLTLGAERLPGRRIGVILSGGNVDLARLPFD